MSKIELDKGALIGKNDVTLDFYVTVAHGASVSQSLVDPCSWPLGDLDLDLAVEWVTWPLIYCI